MIDTGLYALVTIARHYSIPADMQQLERAYSLEKGALDTTAILRAADGLKLRARAYTDVGIGGLSRAVFPAAALLRTGTWVVVMGQDEQHVVLSDPLAEQGRPLQVPKEKFAENWAGTIILFTKRFALPKKFSQFGFSWFFPVIAKYGRFFRSVLFMSFLLQLLGLASPFFTQVIIDRVLVHRSASALDVLILGMVLVTLFQNWMGALRAYLFTHTTSKISVALSSRLFQTITSLPLKFFGKWQVGDVVSRAGELEKLRSFLTGSSLTIVLDIFFAIIYLGVMFLYSKILSLVVLVIMPFFILLNLVVAPIYKKRINDQFLVGAENQSFLIETITGIQTVKSSAVEEGFVKKYEEILARFVSAAFGVINLANIANSIGTFIQEIFSLAILWVGAYYVMQHEITVGELIAFQMIAGQLIAPIMRLVSQWQYFQQTRVSMDRMGDIMNEKTEPAFNPSRTTLPNLAGEIRLDNLSFRYSEDSKPVLENIGLTIPAGMKLGIVGRSGSGKSTLTKLIQRLYLPDKGRVLIDGVDIAQVEPAWLRRQIGIVMQDSFLFGGTIEENIAIAVPNASHEQVAAAAQLAGADEFIGELQHGYDTYVGERGSLLSGGQRQRIAIARALMTDPKILILDEATSALDYDSEKVILDNLGNITKGRTTLMIAHRLSTVRDCDAIVVIDKGRLAEAGSHAELLQHNGIYQHLYSIQQNS